MIQVHDDEIFRPCWYYLGTHWFKAASDAMQSGKFYMRFNGSVLDLYDLPYNYNSFESNRSCHILDRITIFTPENGWRKEYKYSGDKFILGEIDHSCPVCEAAGGALKAERH